MGKNNLVLSDDFGLKLTPSALFEIYRHYGISDMDFLAASPLYSCYQYPGRELRKQALSKWKEALGASCIQIFSFTPTPHGYPVNLSDTNPETRARSLQYYMDYMEDAVFLDADYLTVHPGWYYLEEGKAQGTDVMMNALFALLERAEEKKIPLLLTPSNAEQTNTLQTYEDIACLFEKAASPWLSLAIDLNLLMANGENPDWYANTPEIRTACLDIQTDLSGLDALMEYTGKHFPPTLPIRLHPIGTVDALQPKQYLSSIQNIMDCLYKTNSLSRIFPQPGLSQPPVQH